MRTRNWAALLMSWLVLVMVGCGGGGGSSSPAGTTLSGTAMKGPIAGGTVKVFEIVSSATLNPRANIPRIGTTVLAQALTGSDGSYALAVPASVPSGSLMVQITGGTYTDEATGATRNVADQFGAGGLRTISVYTAGTPVSVAVTPLTEMAVADMGPNPTTAIVNASNAKIAAAFGLADIVNTLPLDPAAAFPASSVTGQQSYTLALAALSQHQKDNAPGQTMAQIIAAMATEIATPANAGGLAPATQTQVDAASNNFAGSASNPNPILNTPTVNPGAPAAIQATLSAGSAQVAAPVTVTVTLTTTQGTPVPDGTVVTFSTNLGNLSATAATTVNGQASVTLTSASAGAASVTATAGSASSVTGVTFVNPSDPAPVNTPANIVLTPSSTPGVADGAAVVLSANVTGAAGSAVADGTTVAFSIVSGTGSLSAASATTSGGVATVNLTSSAAGASVGVRAVAGNASAQLTVPFVAPPPSNDPAGITLSVSPASGFAGGPALTVTANVARSTGAAVPDGTTVAFSIVSGTGTLSAATAATSGGVATVTVSSTAAGTVGVRATAGAVNATTTASFATPAQVVVKVRTTGTLPVGTLIGGINATVTYATNKGLSIAPSAVVASGVGANTLIERNTNNAGQVVLGLITTSGIGLGEFATLTFSIAGGAYPLASDFGIAGGAQVINTTAGTLNGVAVEVLSATVQ